MSLFKQLITVLGLRTAGAKTTKHRPTVRIDPSPGFTRTLELGAIKGDFMTIHTLACSGSRPSSTAQTSRTTQLIAVFASRVAAAI